MSASALTSLQSLFYPIGIVITLGVSTNPATLLGFGTWTAIAGRVIVGIDAGQTEFDTLDETGGSKTHTLTESEMPAHSHQFSARGDDGQDTGAGYGVVGYNLDIGAGSGGMSNAGSGAAHNNLQPYIVKYVWQRAS